MQDTADTTEPAGQADTTTTTDAPPAGQVDATATEDDQAQLLLADAMSQTDNDGQGKAAEGTTRTNVWDDPESARKEIEKVRREAANWRTKFRQAEPQLTEYQQWVDSQKTEQQRLSEAKEAAERELTDLRSANARLMAAATYNIHPDLIELLGTGTEEEIDARAKLLSERLTAAAPPEPAKPAEPLRPSPRRPVESLTPGARPANEAPADPNDAFRDFLNARRS